MDLAIRIENASWAEGTGITDTEVAEPMGLREMQVAGLIKKRWC